MRKKVLGLSFGRKMGNTDVMVKHALMECEKLGHEVKFIHVDELDIKICTGCIACVIGMVSGRGKGVCVIKDDFEILDEELMESDAIIIGSPTYETSPTGRFKTVCDRIGPSHDITFRKATFEEGLKKGKDIKELPDERSFKPRVGALISVGGAMTQNWLVFNLPIMYEFTMPMGIDVIDKMEYFGAMAYEHVLGNKPIMDRAALVGRHISEALFSRDEAERTKWRGDDEGVCPVCYCDLLSVSKDKTYIECPVCGIKGDLTIDNGKIVTTFSKVEQERSRLKYSGKLEHSNEIKTCAAHPGQIPDLKALKAPYVGYAQ